MLPVNVVDKNTERSAEIWEGSFMPDSIDLVGQKIDTLSGNFEKSEKKWDKYIENSNARLRQVETQTALTVQSQETICKKIENLDDEVDGLGEDVKKINLLSKIIGGIAGGLAVIAAAIGLSNR